jgi:hypothetical protein
LKIGASTPYDFSARNLTAYGGLLPVATMLEKLGFQQLIEETLTIRRRTRAMPVYRFVLGMVLVLYVGFSRLNHLRFVEREPMLTGILKVLRVPPQCTFWRFLASLHLSVRRFHPYGSHGMLGLRKEFGHGRLSTEPQSRPCNTDGSQPDQNWNRNTI